MQQINKEMLAVVIGYRADPGERVAITLDKNSGIALGAADSPDRHPGVTSTIDSVTKEVQHLRGFGIWPRWPDSSSAQAWPMRLEFAFGMRGPVTAVVNLGDGLIGRFEFDRAEAPIWRLVIEPTSDADPSAAGLKRFNLGRVLAQVDEWVRHPYVVRARGGDVASAPRRRPGRRGADPLEYAVIAASYVAALGTHPTDPARALVNQAGECGEHKTLTDVRNAVRRARALGMLTEPPVRGRAGGELTARATDLLRSAGQTDLIPTKER
jgi:hypothetical protein